MLVDQAPRPIPGDQPCKATMARYENTTSTECGTKPALVRSATTKASTRSVAYDTEATHRPWAEIMPPHSQSAVVHHHRWLHRGFRDLLMIATANDGIDLL